MILKLVAELSDCVNQTHFTYTYPILPLYNNCHSSSNFYNCWENLGLKSMFMSKSDGNRVLEIYLILKTQSRQYSRGCNPTTLDLYVVFGL